MLAPPDELDEEDEDEDEEGEPLSIVVMARNEPPAFVCRICGKPATQVSSTDDFDSLEEAALCESCAEKEENSDELLPLVNSPRVGVCAYTGEDDDWGEDEDDDWDDEEEDEEEDE